MDEEWILIAIGGLQGTLAVFSNLLVITSITKFEQLTTLTNLFILSLSVVDFMSGLTEFPVSVSLKLLWLNAENVSLSNETLSLPQKGWEIACKMRLSTGMAFTFGNLMAIFYISLERFICIHYPLKYPRIVTKHIVVFAIVIKWALMCFFAVSHWLFTEEMKFPCDPTLMNEYFITVIMIPTTFIILVTSLVLYLKIGLTAYKQSQEIRAQNSQISVPTNEEVGATVKESSLRKRTLSSERKIAKMLGLVIGLYYLSYVPLSVIIIINSKMKNASPVLLNTMMGSARMVYLVSTWINPFVYAWQSKDFRHYFGKLLRIKSLQYQMEDVI